MQTKYNILKNLIAKKYYLIKTYQWQHQYLYNNFFLNQFLLCQEDPTGKQTPTFQKGIGLFWWHYQYWHSWWVGNYNQIVLSCSEGRWTFYQHLNHLWEEIIRNFSPDASDRRFKVPRWYSMRFKSFSFFANIIRKSIQEEQIFITTLFLAHFFPRFSSFQWKFSIPLTISSLVYFFIAL